MRDRDIRRSPLIPYRSPHLATNKVGILDCNPKGRCRCVLPGFFCLLRPPLILLDLGVFEKDQRSSERLIRGSRFRFEILEEIPDFLPIGLSPDCLPVELSESTLAVGSDVHLIPRHGQSLDVDPSRCGRSERQPSSRAFSFEGEAGRPVRKSEVLERDLIR